MKPEDALKLTFGSKIYSTIHDEWATVVKIDTKRAKPVLIAFEDGGEMWMLWDELKEGPGKIPEGPYPDNNPKTALGVSKVPMHLIPPIVEGHLAMAWKNGAAKYGPYNWRHEKISSSVYYAAAKRHMNAWWDGEELAADSNVHHLGHAMACLGMILDGMSVNKLNDDRPPAGAFPQFLEDNNE